MKPLVAVVALLTATALPSTASARGPHDNGRHGRVHEGRGQHRFQERLAPAPPKSGAIARSASTGRIGWSVGYDGLAAAQTEATAQCGESDCLIVAWEQQSCAAFAEGDGAWGASGGTSLEEAQLQATYSCSTHGGVNCNVVRWVCN